MGRNAVDPVERYLDVFEELRRGKRWTTDTNVLRFCALTLAASDVVGSLDGLEAAAKTLASEAGGFSPLSSSVRYAVAAILLRRGLDPATTVRRVRETLTAFKAHKLQKGGIHPLLAALLLVLDSGGGVPTSATIVRLKEIIIRWKKDHFFLTGVDDYPMAAMHATRAVGIEELALEVEQVYQNLRAAKFSLGNPLQMVSHLLVLSDLGPHEAVRTFDRMASTLKAGGQRVWQGQYDEVALLVLSGARVDDAADRAIAYRDRLRAVKPRPSAEIAFSIAAGVVLAEQAEAIGELDDAQTASNLRSVQTILEAQQAAIVACMAASTVATTAASS